jgi:SAM-dependent methyltransferase
MSAHYDPDFYGSQCAGSLRSARQIVPYLINLIRPRSVVDVGCGVGTWLRAFAECGIKDYLGLDGPHVTADMLVIAPDRFMPVDLTEPTTLARTFDLAMCLEVAEHLPEERSQTLVASLSRLSDFVVFGAAIPGQGGRSHLNEQWPQYWADMFTKYKYVAVDCIRPRFWTNPDVDYWYAQNTFCYVRRHRLHDHDLLASEFEKCGGIALPVVHPAAWSELRVQDSLGVRESLALLRRATAAAIRRRLARLAGHVTTGK